MYNIIMESAGLDLPFLVLGVLVFVLQDRVAVAQEVVLYVHHIVAERPDLEQMFPAFLHSPLLLRAVVPRVHLQLVRPASCRSLDREASRRVDNDVGAFPDLVEVKVLVGPTVIVPNDNITLH